MARMWLCRAVTLTSTSIIRYCKNKECLNTLAYYDVVNFARKVTAPTYLTWGYNDVTCPPTTSYAVWNTLKCEKESLVTPINEHWTSGETNRRQMVWIKEHLVK